MGEQSKFGAVVMGGAFVVGMLLLGLMLTGSVRTFKEYDRTVSVKGLSEREYPADVVIWPIQFVEADNDLGRLYGSIESSNERIRAFLEQRGISAEEITVSQPSITDKSAQMYGGNSAPEFRYSATQTVTVYSTQIDLVRKVMNQLPELGKNGIAFTGDDYMARTEYLFTRLNDVKPEMIEEATKNAREVALKFAEDSESKLGKIKTAYQGLFTIDSRDNSTPYIKKVRVVSTVEYYLSD